MRGRFWPALLLLAMWGCGSSQVVVERPQPVPLLRNLDVDSDRVAARLAREPTGTLTLADALGLALLKNPRLKAFSLEIRAREAQALQSSLWPNPELELEVENFGGRGPTRGLRSAESTLLLSQLIELGGKRGKRTEAAELDGKLAAWDYETQKLQVFTDVVQAYVDLLTAQQKVALLQELLKISEKFVQTIEQRVQAGRTSPAEAYRASVELEFTRVELERARKELETARRQLAALWGAEKARFQRATGDLEILKAIPPLAKLETFLERNPEIARWATERLRQETLLSLAKASAIPEPEIGVGYRRLNDENDQAFVVGLSLPIPIFDRGQGNIQEAVLRRQQVEWDERDARIRLKTRLGSVYNALAAAREEVEALEKRILPRARNAYEVIRQGYQSGKFGFLDVLDAQRTLFEVRSRYLEALARYHKQVAELEWLVGQNLGSLDAEE